MSLEGLSPGSYYIKAFLDSIENGVYDSGEPLGVFGGLLTPEAVVVTARENTEDIDFDISSNTPTPVQTLQQTPPPSATPDTIPPAAPDVTPLPEIVSVNMVTIFGTAEYGCKVIVEGGNEPRWTFVVDPIYQAFQITLPLREQQANHLSIYAVDNAGNTSESFQAMVFHTSHIPRPARTFEISEPDCNGNLIITAPSGCVEANVTIEIKNLRTEETEAVMSNELGGFSFDSSGKTFSASTNDPLGITVVNAAGTRSACVTGATGTKINEEQPPRLFVGTAQGSSSHYMAIGGNPCDISQLDVRSSGFSDFRYWLYPSGSLQGKFKQNIEMVKRMPCTSSNSSLYLDILPTNLAFDGFVSNPAPFLFSLDSQAFTDVFVYAASGYNLFFNENIHLDNLHFMQPLSSVSKRDEDKFRLHLVGGGFERMMEYVTQVFKEEAKVWCELGNGVVSPGDVAEVKLIITNQSNDERTFNWGVSKADGSPTVIPGPGSGVVTLGPGSTTRIIVEMYVPVDTLARDEATMRATISGDGEFWDDGKVCVIPIGEITESCGWYWGGIHNWNVTLTPLSSDFSTRIVQEFDPGGGGPDSCHFEGSIFDPVVAVTNVDETQAWIVADGNMLDVPDGVGYGAQMVIYYRESEEFENYCGTTIPQNMKINCPSCASGYAFYRLNTLRAGLSHTLVNSERDGMFEELIWPE